MTRSISTSFKQGWLLGILEIKDKTSRQAYKVTTRELEIVTNIYNICQELNVYTWVLDGYKKGVYEIYIQGKKEDINYLLLNREDNKEFIRGYLSAVYEVKGKVIHTRGWNQKAHREYYIQINSTKPLVLERIHAYLIKQFFINSHLIINPQSISRLRIYKKYSILLLSQELLLSPTSPFSQQLLSLLCLL